MLKEKRKFFVLFTIQIPQVIWFLLLVPVLCVNYYFLAFFLLFCFDQHTTLLLASYLAKARQCS